MALFNTSCCSRRKAWKMVTGQKRLPVPLILPRRITAEIVRDQAELVAGGIEPVEITSLV